MLSEMYKVHENRESNIMNDESVTIDASLSIENLFIPDSRKSSQASKNSSFAMRGNSDSKDLSYINRNSSDTSFKVI